MTERNKRGALALIVWLGFGLTGCAGQERSATAPPGTSPTPAAIFNPTIAGTQSTRNSAPFPMTISPDSIVNAPDRSPEDRDLDAGRHPVQLLEFLDLKQGMKVFEIASGTGYTTELLARAVGPSGVVFGQNSRFILERFAEKPWSERLKKPVMQNVVRIDRDFDDPIPPKVEDLDVVIDVLFYHDTVWQKVDRAKMNRMIFEALRPGGAYFIIDHSARPGAGITEVETNHRIEEQVVRDEVKKAGFQFATSADFLRNPSDTRDWNPSPRAAGERRGTSDRFVLKFVKPSSGAANPTKS